jgi:hypothetical protein
MARDIRNGAWIPPQDGQAEKLFVDGTKLALTWTPQGRSVVLVTDVSVAGYDAYYKGDYSAAFGTFASVVHEKVMFGFSATSVTREIAGRISGYWGFVVDKVMGGAAQSLPFFRAKDTTCSVGKQC